MVDNAHRRVVPIGVGLAAALWLAHATSATEPTGVDGLVVPPSSASILLYVDGDANAGAPPDECPGDGSDASPFRSLSCAFASGSIAVDTAILLRDSDVPYEGVDSRDHTMPSGAFTAEISIEPAPGHAPIMAGPIVLAGLDSWTIRNLVFDGSAGAPPGEAIRIEGAGMNVTDRVTIEGVSILNWPGRGIVLRGVGSSFVQQADIIGNRIENAQDVGIWVENAISTTIRDNEITQLECVAVSFSVCDECGMDQCAECGDCLDAPMEECTASTSYDRGHQSGVRVLGESRFTTIEDNYIHDFLDDDCGVEGTRTAGLFITGAQAEEGTIERNLIERIAPGNPDNGFGILMFQGASQWQVQRNVLSEIGRCALCEGDDLFYGSRDTVWSNNTVADVTGAGIDVRWAHNVQFRGNLVTETQNGAVRVWEEGIAEAPAFDYNLYWNAAGTVLAFWGELIVLTLENWQMSCECDVGAAWDDPMLPVGPPVDFTPGFEGPAIDLMPGDPMVDPYNGDAFDAGALEAPVPVEARIETGNAKTIVVFLDNNVHLGPSGPLSCAGLSVQAGGIPRPLVECTATPDALLLNLAETIPGDPAIAVTYTGGQITTGATIGGRIGASLPPFEIGVTNESPIPEDDTDGDPTDGFDSTAGSEFTDGGFDDAFEGSFDGGFNDFGGCGCRSSPSPLGSMGLAWLLLLARRRRPFGDHG